MFKADIFRAFTARPILTALILGPFLSRFFSHNKQNYIYKKEKKTMEGGIPFCLDLDLDQLWFVGWVLNMDGFVWWMEMVYFILMLCYVWYRYVVVVMGSVWCEFSWCVCWLCLLYCKILCRFCICCVLWKLCVKMGSKELALWV